MQDLAIRGFGTMTIGGEERPFHLGTYQARVFCEQQGLELDGYLDALATLEQPGLKTKVLVQALLYSALVAGAKFKKLPHDFDADDVSFWMDNDKGGEVGKFFAVANALSETGPASGNAPGQPVKARKKK